MAERIDSASESMARALVHYALDDPAIGRLDAVRRLAKRSECVVLDHLEHAPFLLLQSADSRNLTELERQPGVLAVSPVSEPSPPSLETLASRPTILDGAVCMIERGRPDLDHPCLATRARQVILDGDHSVQPHPTAVLAAILEARPFGPVLCLSLPRAAGQWAWLSSIDRALARGIRIFNLSFGRHECELEVGWDRFEMALEIFTAVTGACFVAAAGNRPVSVAAPADVYIPARHPAVLAVSGLMPGEDGSWRAFGRNCASARDDVADTEVCASAVDPTGGVPGTSLAAARVSPLLGEIVRRQPDAAPGLIRSLTMASASFPGETYRPVEDPHGFVDRTRWVGRSLGLGTPNMARLSACLDAGRFRTGSGSASIELEAEAPGDLHAVLCWQPRATDDLLRIGDDAAWVPMQLHLHPRGEGAESLEGVGGRAWRAVRGDVGDGARLRVIAPPGQTWSLAWNYGNQGSFENSRCGEATRAIRR